jgi:hypothetical protein
VCVCVCACVRLGFELRSSHLQSRYSTTWAVAPVHFALVILEMGCHKLFVPAGLKPQPLPISTSPSQVWATGACDGLTKFLVSVSLVAVVKDMNKQVQSSLFLKVLGIEPRVPPIVGKCTVKPHLQHFHFSSVKLQLFINTMWKLLPTFI